MPGIILPNGQVTSVNQQMLFPMHRTGMDGQSMALAQLILPSNVQSTTEQQLDAIAKLLFQILDELVYARVTQQPGGEQLIRQGMIAVQQLIEQQNGQPLQPAPTPVNPSPQVAGDTQQLRDFVRDANEPTPIRKLPQDRLPRGKR